MPRPPTTAALDVAAALEQLLRVVRRLATAGDLGVSAASVLARLSADGSQRLTDLATQEDISQPGMTQLVTRLERDGLVRRTASPSDGRVVVVTVTAAGKALVARRRAERVSSLQALLSQMDTSEQAAMRDALPAFVHLADLARRTTGSGRGGRPDPGGAP